VKERIISLAQPILLSTITTQEQLSDENLVPTILDCFRKALDIAAETRWVRGYAPDLNANEDNSVLDWPQFTQPQFGDFLDFSLDDVGNDGSI
jgi:hypothetical protein